MTKSGDFSNILDDEIPVSVNPNPAKDYLVINTDKGNNINIIDSGKSIVYSTTVTAIDTKINLLNFDSGIYSLVITNAGGARVVKVLKI